MQFDLGCSLSAINRLAFVLSIIHLNDSTTHDARLTAHENKEENHL